MAQRYTILPIMANRGQDALTSQGKNRALRRAVDDLIRGSAESLRLNVQRGGGEPFGAPHELGLQSLTERIVAVLKQKGFFAFEAFERLLPRNRRNKFTRHGAARYRGDYRK